MGSGFNVVELDGAMQAPGSAKPTRGVQVLGQDGANSQVLLVDSSGRPIVQGPGVAGAPAGGVMSIQGVLGGQSIPVTISASSITGLVVQKLQNAGDPDMRVNGSLGTPVNFTVDADPTNDILLTAIRLIMAVNTSVRFDGASFGAGNGLTNGVAISITVDSGTTIPIATIHTNEEFLIFSNVNDPILSFDSAHDLISVQFTLSERVRLVAGTADKVQVAIQDDLTSGVYQLNFFQAVLYGVKV